jgi:hypothetical protein
MRVAALDQKVGNLWMAGSKPAVFTGTLAAAIALNSLFIAALLVAALLVAALSIVAPFTAVWLKVEVIIFLSLSFPVVSKSKTGGFVVEQ